MKPFASNMRFANQLLSALGLEGHCVTDIAIYCGMESVPTVMIREFVRDEVAEDLVAVLKTYRLEDKTMQEQVEPPAVTRALGDWDPNKTIYPSDMLEGNQETRNVS